MGTFVDVFLSGAVNDHELIDLSNDVFEEVTRIQTLMSFHDPLSELSLMNKALLTNVNTPYQVSSDLYHVLTLASELHCYSDGYYDITVAPQLVNNNLLPDHLAIKTQANSLNKLSFGTSNNFSLFEKVVENSKQTAMYISNDKPLCIDLGGIAKGYAVDCAIKKLPSSINYTINAGGDMKSSIWQGQKVALKYAKRHRAIKEVTMKKQALASSGLYHQEVGSHIFNPKKSKANNQLVQHKFGGVVSVFANTAVLADALTKAAILMDKTQLSYVLEHFDASAIIINRFGFKRFINV